MLVSTLFCTSLKQWKVKVYIPLSERLLQLVLSYNMGYEYTRVCHAISFVQTDSQLEVRCVEEQ